VEDLRQLDIDYLWHPCTDINELAQRPVPIIDRALGVYLYETNGRPLLDGIASWWCVNLGHGHPRLIEAIQRQAPQLQHAILGGMSHPNAVLLAQRLAGITPGDLRHSFFCSDGASAVEAALKIAVQYWANVGETGRTGFVGLVEGYHGDTLGAMGVGYVEAFHHDYREVVRPAHHALSPHCAQGPYQKQPESCDIECFYSMENILRTHHTSIAAVIVEPLCQAAAGIRIYPAEYLRRLRKLCDGYGLILIADEIAVGFGRTGSMFACQQAGIVPDIMTIGKGITGGYLPLSAAVASDDIYNSFRNRNDARDNTFWHSHTFGGNPIITALALAAIDVYEDEHIIEQCQPRIAQLARGMAEVASLLPGSKTRSLGMIGVVEISDACGGAARAAAVVRKGYELGLFLRPRGRAIYLWPPLTTTGAELEQMLSIIRRSVQMT
jgi:adenosylmethionine-8-amino-7-oxononanoate aminotransferase